MHRFLQRLQACEASGWEPLKRGQVKDTKVFHTAACGLNHKRPLCDCDGEVYAVLRDESKYRIGLDGKAELVQKGRP